jgi:WhiB family redox-sensing transcriptional regulator
MNESSVVTVKTTWRDEAACKGLDTGIFFPTTDAEAGAAKLVCAGCPVRAECLEWALASRQEDGVWGGLTDNERRRLRRRRRDAARRAAAASAA